MRARRYSGEEAEVTWTHPLQCFSSSLSAQHHASSIDVLATKHFTPEGKKIMGGCAVRTTILPLSRSYTPEDSRFYAQHRAPPLTLPPTLGLLSRKRLKQPKRSGRMVASEILISRTQLARQLGLTRDTLRRWARIGHGPTPVKLSRGCVRYRPSDVRAFLDSRSAEPVA
jgi:predicted DNA-binding transcriptional regulator AlpA